MKIFSKVRETNIAKKEKNIYFVIFTHSNNIIRLVTVNIELELTNPTYSFNQTKCSVKLIHHPDVNIIIQLGLFHFHAYLDIQLE